jgi:hypothetical protein
MFGERDQDNPENRALRGVARGSSQLPVGLVAAPLLALQRRVGNRAMTRLLQRARTAAEIKEDWERVHRELEEERRVAEDLIEETASESERRGLSKGRPVTDTETKQRLRELARRGDKRAKDVLKRLEELEKEEQDLFDELEAARSRFYSSGGAKAGAASEEARVEAAEKEAGKEAGGAAEERVVEEAGGTGRVPGEPTVAAERVGEDAAADLAEEAAGTAAEGLTFAETVGAALEAIGAVLDVLFLAQAGYALGKALIFHNPGEMDPEQLKLMHLMETNVMPAALKALQAHEQEARKLALRAPELDVFAKVTMTITYGADGALSQDKSPTMVYDDEQLEDAQFNTVSVGHDSATAKKDGGETHHYADNKDHRRRMQIITFPILLNPLGQSRRLRRFVAMRANAAKAIARGLSARSIAEGTHWVGDHMGPGGYEWTYLDDREEARRKKAMAPSHRAEIELAAKIAFTEAYIDAASDHIDQPTVRKLYDDAVRYYDELQRTTIDPRYRPVTKQPRQQSFPLKPR